MSLQLVLPSAKYKKSFLEAQEEKKQYEGQVFTRAGNTAITEEGFADFLQQRKDERQGINLQEGYVSSSAWWLVDNDEWLGEIRIRHSDTPLLLRLGGHIGFGIRPSVRRRGVGSIMLELGLLKAKEMGFEKVLLTCDDDNFGSARVIEKNGGVLENIVERKDEELEGILAGKTRRYWITL